MIYIISYPRSGNTAFRYILEMLTGQPTNGICGELNPADKLQQPLLHKGTDFVAHKRHDFEGVTENDTVIFIMRDPLEAVIRHNQHRAPLTYENLRKWIDGWFDLYERYKNHKGGGMVIHYDQLTKIADKASKDLYPNPQSDNPHFHKRKVDQITLGYIQDYIETKW